LLLLPYVVVVCLVWFFVLFVLCFVLFFICHSNSHDSEQQQHEKGDVTSNNNHSNNSNYSIMTRSSISLNIIIELMQFPLLLLLFVSFCFVSDVSILHIFFSIHKSIRFDSIWFDSIRFDFKVWK
jgi:hypothetical protein